MRLAGVMLARVSFPELGAPEGRQSVLIPKRRVKAILLPAYRWTLRGCSGGG
jgi:hypothetical protein